MSYIKFKNIKMNKKENRIGGEFADSNVFDYKGKNIYKKCVDLYPNINDYENKKVAFYLDIISGNLHPKGNKLSNLICTFDNDLIHDYYNHKDAIFIDKAYRRDFIDTVESLLKDNCILKKKEAPYRNSYILRINKKSYSLTYDKEKAKKFNDKLVGNYFLDNYTIEYI